jgi:hypothetical protein
MKPSAPYLYEFVWRGRAPDEDTIENPAAWHVAIETRLDAGGELVVPHVRTLNVAQAIEEGWPLAKISETINFETLAELEAARAENVHLADALEHANNQVDQLAAFSAHQTAVLKQLTDQLPKAPPKRTIARNRARR